MNLLRPPYLRFTYLAVLALFTLRLSATEYFVDYSNGYDGNVGTGPGYPWQHCPGDPAATTLPAAVTLGPGDKVVFKGGVTYVLTGKTGIQLQWNGSTAGRITYDGNSAGTWGTGRAVFTDLYGGNNVAVFSASSAVSYLAFNSLEFAGVGGSLAVPFDSGTAEAPRYGAGILFNGGVSNAVINGCVFHHLGYSWTQKPMNAGSVSGTGIGFANASTVTISNCDFSHVASAIEMYHATSLSGISITNCTFHDNVLWTVDLPSSVTPTNFQISDCSETNNLQFTSGYWTGYGSSPRTDVLTADAGSSITFQAAAAASPSASFQWYKNGQLISGATVPTLTLSSVSTSDAATYTVNATNCAGTTTSNDAVLTVTAPVVIQTAPVIVTQPVSQTVALYTDVTFSVGVTGTPAPTYQWFKKGALMLGWTDATLVMPYITTNDETYYSVVVTNSAGSVTSNPVNLTVAAPVVTTPASPTSAPVITSQPASRTANLYTDVTFAVVATGTPAPTYQWFKKGALMLGWTDATLVMPYITTNDETYYSVVVTNSAGSVTSNTVNLTVNAPVVTTPTSPASPTSAPVITSQPASRTANLYTDVTFTVVATGTPAPTYQWFKKGALMLGWTDATLVMPYITTNDETYYSVVVTNSAGSVTSNTVNLTVATPVVSVPTAPAVSPLAPVITSQPVSRTANLYTDVTFTVVATGTPAPTYQWTKKGAVMSGWTDATLLLPCITTNDETYFSVIVTNNNGSVTSQTVNLTVANSPAAPAFTTQPQSQTITPGASVQLVAVASGFPVPTFQWYRNGTMVKGATSSSLTLRNVTKSSIGTYTVTASNSVGTAKSAAATLTFSTVATSATTAPGQDLTVSTLSVTAAPQDQTVALGGTAQFAVAASSTGTLYYQWYKDDVAISSATNPTFTVSNVQSADVGAYTVELNDGTTVITTEPANLSVAAENARSRLVNLSVRSGTGTGAETMTVGFVVGGAGTKSLLVRGVGASLTDFGVTDAVSHPRLKLFSGTTMLGENAGWSTGASAAAIKTAGDSVGAFPLNDSGNDAALLPQLGGGAYTAQIGNDATTSGTALLELYDLAQTSSARLTNVSVRTKLVNGSSPIVGFAVTGTASKQILIRAAGPSLSSFGVDGVLADPALLVYHDKTVLQQNDNWNGASSLTTAFAQVGAFAYDDPESKDAAVLLTVAPGTYSVVVNSANGGSGVVLVEIYEIP